jgi:hypothetical protein
MNTALFEQISPRVILDTYEKLDYKMFTDNSKNLNLNAIGFRSNERKGGKFDDLLGFWYVDPTSDSAYITPEQIILVLFAGTTDPSRKYLLNPMTGNRTLIMKAGQYLQCYALCGPGYASQNKYGLNGHGKNKILALRQIGDITYWLDTNKDEYLSIGEAGVKTFTGIRQTNIHPAARYQVREWIGPYGAACQVLQVYANWLVYIDAFVRSAELWGNCFSYTLIEEHELVLVKPKIFTQKRFQK